MLVMVLANLIGLATRVVCVHSKADAGLKHAIAVNTVTIVRVSRYAIGR